MTQYNNYIQHISRVLLLILSLLSISTLTAQAQLRTSTKQTRSHIEGAAVSTGVITVEITSGTAPYTATITTAPAGFTGPRSYSFDSNKLYICNLPEGRYELTITDQTGATSTGISTITTQSIERLADRPTYWTQRVTKLAGQPNWVSMPINVDGWLYTPDVDADSPFEYSFCTQRAYADHPETMQWTILQKEDTPPSYTGTVGVWQVDGAEGMHLFMKLPDGITANKMASTYYYDQIGIAVRLKGATTKGVFKPLWSNQASFESYDPEPWINIIPNETEEICKYLDGFNPGIQLKESLISKGVAGLAFPITVHLDDPWVNGGQTLVFTEADYTETKHFNNLKYQYCYNVYITDANGNDSSTKIQGTPNERYIPTGGIGHHFKYGGGWGDIRNYDVCAGTTDVVLKLMLEEEHYGVRYAMPFANAKITLITAPADYVPQNQYFPQLNVPLQIPAGHTSNELFPFPSASAPADNPYMAPYYEVKIPEGKYTFRFEWTSLCGEPQTMDVVTSKILGDVFTFRYYAKKIEYGTERANVAPEVLPEGCDKVRIYPFRGMQSRDLLRDHGKPIRVYAFLTQYPILKLTNKDFTSNQGGYWNRPYAYLEPTDGEGLNPDDIYIEMPQGEKDQITIQYTYTRDYLTLGQAPCLDLKFQFTLGPISFDYEGYICPSGTSAHISLTPQNIYRDATVALLDVETGAVIKSVDYPASSTHAVTFDLRGDEIRTKYKVEIKEKACTRSNGGEIVNLIDLRNNDFIYSYAKFKYCEDDRMVLVANLGDIPNSHKVYWTLPDGSTIEGSKVDVASVQSSIHSGHYQLTIEGLICEGVATTQTFDFDVSVAPLELWWRSNAISADWHSLHNWADSKGLPILAVPASCTTVHLPAVVDQFFPDLDPAKTSRATFGEPVCDLIYFHHGAALGSPQRLTYVQAYVDYNFGITQPGGAVQAYDTLYHTGADSKLLERDRWYMVATPLKNVYAGDFSLAGYPLTYQRYLKVAQGADTPTEASFDYPISKLGQPLHEYNMALALKVSGYQAGKIGASDHKNLNGLNGIIRIPYYQDYEREEFYPLHKYNDREEQSVLIYFNLRDLKPVNKFDQVARNSWLDYRFVFEDEYTEQIASVTLPSGDEVEGYSMPLSRVSEAPHQLAMVGNPFMTPISFDQLYAANNPGIAPYYYILANGAWRYYQSGGAGGSLNGQIAPLQAFVVKVEEGCSEFRFPTEGAHSVLLAPQAGATADYELQRGEATGESTTATPQRKVLLTLSDGRGGYSTAALLPDSELSSVPALMAPEGSRTAPIAYFVDPTSGAYNFVQTRAPYARIELGIYAPQEGMLSLDFSGMTAQVFDQLTLYDRLTGYEQDLLADAHYSYAYSARDGRRFELRMSYSGITAIQEMMSELSDLRIERTATGYRLTYDEGLTSYQLYTIDGLLLQQADLGRQSSVEIQLQTSEVLLLDLQSADGRRWIKKLQH